MIFEPRVTSPVTGVSLLASMRRSVVLPMPFTPISAALSHHLEQASIRSVELKLQFLDFLLTDSGIIRVVKKQRGFSDVRGDNVGLPLRVIS